MNEGRTLDSWWNGRLVGRFSETANRLAEFVYHEDYDGYPISVAMPVQQEPHRGRVPFDFLSNLLPEVDRDRLARSYRLATDDTFGLIGALGRECAGALQIVPSGETPNLPTAHYRPLTRIERENWLESRETQPLLKDRDGRIRLSLAGAQAKTAVFVDSDGEVLLPIDGAATTHILKPSIRGFSPNSAHIELYCMRLAQQVLGPGDVPDTDLWENLYRVRRFDRIIAGGSVARLHQEDLCQALGLGVGAKYEVGRHGSDPGYIARAMDLLLALGDAGLVGSPAVERLRLLDRILFNVLVHNADAHLKNYGLLYTEAQGLRIAPLYDCLCTSGIVARPSESLPYGENRPVVALLSTELGLRIGDAADIREITADDWSALARQCGMTPRFVVGRIRELAEAVRASAPAVADAVVTEYPKSEASVLHVVREIEQQGARLR